MPAAKRKTNRKKTGKKKFTSRKLFYWLLGVVSIAIFCGLAGYLLVIVGGEKMLHSHIGELNMDEASILYDASDQEVTKLYRQNRVLVSYSEIPPLLVNAFIATEDKRFREHKGLDYWSIGRALYTDITQGGAVEGGSTITQQLAKNMFLPFDKTLFRKAKEAAIAMAMENQYTKDQILEMYLNRIYFGGGAYGIKAAAKLYFNKDLQDLDLAQIATLAAIPKSPGNYSPLLNPQNSLERRELVLSLMYEQGYITKDQMEKASAEKYVKPDVTSSKQDYQTFIDYVLQEANEETGLTDDQLLRGGYEIYTTMDATAQKAMEQAYEKDQLFQKNAADGEKIQSGMVIVNRKDGGIVAMIGGRDYVAKGLNHATAKRQPGSSFKPIAVYGPALETGKWNPYSMLKDEKMSFGSYSPENYNHQYPGEVTMFYALEKSENLPAVWLLDQIGVDKGVAFARKLGIDLGSKDRNLAMALGGLTEGVSPLQMAEAYAAFDNNGYYNQGHAIRMIKDSQGKVIYQYKPVGEQAMSPQTAYYMTLLLREVVREGTATQAQMNRPVAGKTGSTQYNAKGDRDIWFVGYTPEWSAAVWEGFDKTDAGHYVTVGSGATAAIFKTVMSAALKDHPMTSFQRPEGIADPQKPQPTPQPISDLKAEYDAATRAVILTWSPLDGSDIAYYLYRKGPQDKDYKQLLSSPTTQINDIIVTPGETYQYYITAYHTGNGKEGNPSNEVSVTVPDDNGDAGSGLQPGESGTDASPGSASGSPTPGDDGTTTNPDANPGPTPSSDADSQPTPTPSATSGSPQPGSTPGSTPGAGSTENPGASASPAPGSGTGTPQPSPTPGGPAPSPSASPGPASDSSNPASGATPGSPQPTPTP